MLYFIGRNLFWLLFKLLGLRVEGQINIPKEGPLIVAGNHVSNWDPILIAAAINRPVCYMGKAELFNTPFKNWLMRELNVFPVERGKGDLAAIRTALNLLKENKVMGMFPEGRRNMEKDYDLTKVSAGVGFLAAKSGARVLPVAVVGSDLPLPFGYIRPLKVVIGHPMAFKLEPGEKKNSEKFSQFSQNVMQKIYSML